MRSDQILDSVDQAEETQVFDNGQIARQRRVDGDEIGARERPGAVLRQVHVFDPHGSGIGFEHAENHVDGRGFPRAIRAEKADDFVASDREREAVHRNGFAVLFAKIGNGKNCGSHDPT